MNRAKEMQLRKEFPPYNHLPIEALEFVKEKLEEFNSHRKCQIEKTEGLSELQVRWRQ
jgi:CMP-2-keto-3-deoxyoctulosonic acid synthetase